MNIFKILSTNDGTINEPNVSSFLAYLLDPYEDHGLSSILLQELLIDFKEIDSTFLSQLHFEDRITDLSRYSKFDIVIQPEFTVFLEPKTKNKKRDIDILIEIKNSKTDQVIYAICIENKITDLSINKKDNQLEEELEGLKNYYKESDSNPEIYLIYLTPEPSKISTESFQKLQSGRNIHLYWNNHEKSIFNKLINIFDMENKGVIDPINNQSAYLIRSFLSFINTGFKNYLEEKQENVQRKKYGKPVIDHLNDYSKTLIPDKEYLKNEIKEGFSEYVKKVSGVDLVKNTRDAHIDLSTVNEKNRVNRHVKRPDNDRKNIFYYPSEKNKKILKLYDKQKCNNVKIYYKGKDEYKVLVLESTEADIL